MRLSGSRIDVGSWLMSVHLMVGWFHCFESEVQWDLVAVDIYSREGCPSPGGQEQWVVVGDKKDPLMCCLST